MIVAAFLYINNKLFENGIPFMIASVDQSKHTLRNKPPMMWKICMNYKIPIKEMKADISGNKFHVHVLEQC